MVSFLFAVDNVTGAVIRPGDLTFDKGAGSHHKAATMTTRFLFRGAATPATGKNQ